MKANKEAAKFLTQLAFQNNGLLLPKTVVAAARPATSPIHKWFEWDNTKAAAAYRLQQARELIRVTVEVVGEKRIPMRCFVSLTSDRKKDGGYRLTTEVLSDKQRRAQMLADAMAELAVFQRKYQALQELSQLFTVARRIRQGVVEHTRLAA